jgi:3-phenylpropionate/trans-cinnamate dioxygenase ferredoxin reductase subunit
MTGGKHAMKKYDVAVVGGGHGGANTAIALRQQGFEGSVAMVSAEQELPYERPPLSKAYLLGERSFDQLLIRPADFWSNSAIDVLLNSSVTSIDADKKVISGPSGDIGYGKLVWATGGSPRRLPCGGHHLRGVHTIRDRADIDRLTTELDRARQVVVIGGGYIGLEAAAAISKRGSAKIILLEAFDRVLARVAAEPLSRFYEAEHRAHGIEIEAGVRVEELACNDGQVTGVRLQGGRVVEADIVIVGIGIVPAVEPLIALGAAGDAGVEVDIHCRTELPDIFAVGDCTLQVHDFSNGQRIRLESVQNAVDQATITARSILGKAAPLPRAVPRFWSDQFDLKLQTIGLSQGHDDVVVRGRPDDRKFSVAYLRRGQLIALDCVNTPQDFAHGRALISAGARPDRALLENPELKLADTCIAVSEH